MKTGNKILWIVVIAILVAAGTIQLSGGDKAKGQQTPTDDGSNRRRAVIDSSFRNMESGDERKTETAQIRLMRLGKPGIKLLIEEMGSPNSKRAIAARDALFVQWPTAYEDLVVAANCGDPSIEVGARSVLTKMKRVSDIAEMALSKVEQLEPRVEKLETKTAGPDAEDRMARTALAVAKPTASAKPAMSAEELAGKKARLGDKVVWLQRQVKDKKFDILCLEKTIHHPGLANYVTISGWRDDVDQYKSQLVNLQSMLTQAQSELAAIR